MASRSVRRLLAVDDLRQAATAATTDLAGVMTRISPRVNDALALTALPAKTWSRSPSGIRRQPLVDLLAVAAAALADAARLSSFVASLDATLRLEWIAAPGVLAHLTRKYGQNVDEGVGWGGSFRVG